MSTIFFATPHKRHFLQQASAGLTALALGIVLAAAPVLAATQQTAPPQEKHAGQPTAFGGFTGPSLAVSTVNDARSMRDDARVVLRGHIVRGLGGERYLFQDSTGTITVEIDHKLWQGQYISPEDLVEIQAEVERDMFSLELEVDKITKQ